MREMMEKQKMEDEKWKKNTMRNTIERGKKDKN